MQEEREYQSKKMKSRERFVLGIYSIYVLAFLFFMSYAKRPEWLVVLLTAGIVICWIQSLINFQSYRFRAYFLAIFMQLVLAVYSVHIGGLPQLLPNYLVVLVLLGLYEMVDLLAVPMVSITFMIILHAFVLKTTVFESPMDGAMIILRLLAVYAAQYALYYLVKRQNENRVRLQQTIEDLRVAEQSKDDFLANVSHEIRTPINTICGISEIILRERIADGVQENVYSIQNAGRNLLSVVSDILDFSELQSGKVELVEEVYNISSTLNDVINMSMAKIFEKPIELIVDCDANVPSGLIGDEQKIRRVMMNLLGNAIKFTSDGCVSIHIAYRRESYGINLIVSVKDTGIGMTKESLEKLFTSFNQVDTARNRRGEGIGLGLAISQAIIQKMGGFLTIRSEYGKGSEVQFVIPQQVENEDPIVAIHNAKDLNVIVFIDLEHFSQAAVREEYSTLIMHMATQLGVRCHACRDLAELQRRSEREDFTHVFISLVEYRRTMDYFDELALHTKVIVIIDQIQEKKITNPNLQKIFKPFFILNVVSALNGENTFRGSTEPYYSKHERFIAPDAHILVVDDNVMNIRVLEGLLKPYQIRVTMATSGRQALAKIETMNYDFVFMDHMMPEMDGIETLQEIRKKQGSYYKQVPIIALTANAVAGTREMFLQNGFQDYVAKPVEISVLERVLRRHIPKAKIVKIMEQRVIPESVQSEDKSKAFTIGDFDVNRGISYCGSLENYIEALRMYCVDGSSNRAKLQKLYEDRDWKNYTILVHALKSGMASIGAMQLSDLARSQEVAGKNGNEKILLKYHGEMMEEYDRVMKILVEHELIGPSQAEEAPEKQAEQVAVEEAGEVLSEEELERLAAEFEDAAYSFDEAKLLSILEELENYRYHGKSLKEEATALKKKVQMSDYMSALNVLTGWKEKF